MSAAAANGSANGAHVLQAPSVPALNSAVNRDEASGDAQSLSAAVAQAGNQSNAGTNAIAEPTVIRRKLNGFVGFSNLPQQWHQKSIRKGFNLNVMVVGESGLGKSTLLNTLFETPLHNGEAHHYGAGGGAGDESKPTVEIQPVTAELEENGVRLRLTVIDTPGFGDFVNNLDSWQPIVNEIDARFNQYLDDENSVNRGTIVDNRVHACLYFIEPTGHALKPLDVVVMKKLHKKVNLIPVIAKADTLTDAELELFKASVRNDIEHQGIQTFQPPRYANDDEETQAETAELMAKFPFAVVGSTQLVHTPDGRAVRGREYPWGVIEVDNEDQCDFVKLRSLLVRNHLEDLRERTAHSLFENYRTDKMLEMGISQDDTVFREVNPALRQEEERALHEQRLAKMEAEMRSVFQQKVTEKEAKLKKSEAELFAKHKEIKEQLDRQRAELEARKAKLEQQAASQPPVVDEKKARKGFLR